MLKDDFSAITQAVFQSLNVKQEPGGAVQLDRAAPDDVRQDMVNKCLHALNADQGISDAEKIAAFDELSFQYKMELICILIEFSQQGRLPYKNFDVFRSTHSCLPDQVINALFSKDMHQVLHEMEVILTDPQDGGGYW